MRNKIIIISIFLSLFLLSFKTFSQDYINDTLAVRAILDSNGLYSTSAKWVSDSSGGRVTNLDLQDRGLNNIPSEIGNLTALSYLMLYNNSLINIPSEIGNLTVLQFLGLSQNNITNIPVEIGNLSELDYLFLEENNLESIPSEIENLAKIRGLGLNKNKLTIIPPEIGKLTTLEGLYLGNNNLNNIPSEIGNLYNLNRFDIPHNSLTTLPDSIAYLIPSVRLDLGYNKLDTNNLSGGVIAWADEFDPDWKETQNMTNINSIIANNNPFKFSINCKNSSLLFYLPTSGNAKLQIYNMKGRLISTLVDSHKQAGKHTVNWDSKRFGSGVYFLKLSVNGSAVSKKFTIIK